MKLIGDYKLPKGVTAEVGKVSVIWRRGTKAVATLKENPHHGVQFHYTSPSGRRMDEYGEDGYRKCVNNIKAVDRYEAKVAVAMAEYNTRQAVKVAEINERFGASLSVEDNNSEYMKETHDYAGHRVDYRLHANEINVCIDLHCITDEKLREILAILRS